MLKSLPGKELLPASPFLKLTDVTQDGSRWIVSAEGPDRAACPDCGRVSDSLHSHYVRTLKDLPALGAPVLLKIRVGRWRCTGPRCKVRFFTGCLPGVAEFRARRTDRANVITQLIGYVLGGRPGERLSKRIGLPVSNDTLLRWLKKCAKPSLASAPVIGVDEWAKCKARTYGTIVVDLEHNTVIDVLDQHSSESVEQWLSAHPEIHTICRDRNGRYGKAARKGAPAAKQVADRFHLVQNLRETIERELALHRAHLRVTLASKNAPKEPLPTATLLLGGRTPVARERTLPPARRLATQTEISRQSRQNQQTLFDKFKILQANGLKISVIAQQLGLNRRRFDKWAKQSQLPERNKMQPSPGSAETFREYLRQRWDAGYRNGKMLLDELQAMGYVGTYKSVGKVLAPWRCGNVAFESAANEREADLTILPSPPHNLTDPAQRQISPQIAAALLTKPRPELTASQAEIVDALKAGCPGYAAMRKLMMSFRAILKQPKLKPSKKKRTPRTVTALHRWMDRARVSGIALIRNFEQLLQRDILAVEAAVTEKWSNGPVEGQVNRLKTIKRQMYGRAGVELLRARLIPLSPAPIFLQRE